MKVKLYVVCPSAIAEIEDITPHGILCQVEGGQEKFIPITHLLVSDGEKTTQLKLLLEKEEYHAMEVVNEEGKVILHPSEWIKFQR